MEARRAEVEDLLARIARWAAQRSDVRALGLAGSWARGEPGPHSDVDLVLLTQEPWAYVRRSAWASEVDGIVTGTRGWGAITERRLRLPSSLELDVGIGQASWASTNPVDPGTRAVVEDGFRILYDPHGLLAALTAECGLRP